ncbi:ABC transporter substrate-binding protein [Actimicrobium antarcticum]
MLQTAAAFTAAHPSIHVNVQFMIGNSVEENIKPKVASNTLPDIVSVNPNAYAAELADQGFLADLGTTFAWANMLDSLKPDWTSNKGKHFGISGGVAATLVYYNESMFRKAGITALPADFEAFLAVCAQLKQAGLTPIIWNGGFPNVLGNGPFSSGFANNIVATHPDWKKEIANGSLDLATTEGADIFGKIKLIAERGYVQKNFMNTNYDEGIKLFTEGKVAMAFHGTWASGLLMDGDGFNTGVFLPPWNAHGKMAVPVIGSETGFAVSDTPNKAAALQFLEFMTGEGYPMQQNKRQNIAPMKVVQGTMVSNPKIAAYIDAISAYPVTASPYYAFLPASTITLTHTLLQDVLFGKETPQGAAQRLDDSVKNEARIDNK